MPLGEIQLNNSINLNRPTSMVSKKTIDPVQIDRRNQRERNRVKLLSLGFDRLRAVVPSRDGEQLSKIATLRGAIWYIEHLARLLDLPTLDKPQRSQDSKIRGQKVEKLGSGKSKNISAKSSSVEPKRPTVSRRQDKRDRNGASSFNVVAGSPEIVSQITGLQDINAEFKYSSHITPPVVGAKASRTATEINNKENQTWTSSGYLTPNRRENNSPIFPNWQDAAILFQASTPVQQTYSWSSSSAESGFYNGSSSSSATSFDSSNYSNFSRQSPMQAAGSSRNNQNQWNSNIWNLSTLNQQAPAEYSNGNLQTFR